MKIPSVSWSQRWLPIVLSSISILLITAFGFVNVANYCIQVSGPELAPVEQYISLNSPPLKPSIAFNWNSSGKVPAVNGKATLYAATGKKLGEATIGTRSTLTPTFGFGS